MTYQDFTQSELENEVWKQIEGFETRYEVSNLGRVKSLVKKKTRILKLSPDAFGYLRISLYGTTSKCYSRYVHILVADAFLSKRLPHQVTVNHKNGIKIDNKITNLEFLSISENIRHAIDCGLRKTKGEKHGRAKLTEKQVKDIRERLANGEKQRILSKEFGVARTTISAIKMNILWKE